MPTVGRANARRRNAREAIAISVLVALAVLAVHHRETIVRALPSSAGLYQAVGFPVNLRGLAFETLAQHRGFEDGVPVLIVEGEILNVTDRAVQMPALRFALGGNTGDELYAWTLEPRQRMIEPNAAMSFRTRLASPPREADTVSVRFTERGQNMAELEK